MTDWTAAQLKELIGSKICDERRLRDALREEDHKWVEREFASVAKALELQAKEYERRLDQLNHAHAEAQHVLGTYLPREIYERAIREIVEWQRKADLKEVENNNRIKAVELGLVNLPGGVKSLEIGLASQAGQKLGTSTARTTMIATIAAIIAAIGVTVGVFGYFSK